MANSHLFSFHFFHFIFLCYSPILTIVAVVLYNLLWFWPFWLCQSFVRGSHLLPSQLPWEHTVVLPHAVHSTCLHFAIISSSPYTRRIRNPVVGHESDGPQVVLYVHQSHRHDSTHPSFLLSQVPLIYIWSTAQLGMVMDHFLSNPGRMVTHPCLNWACDGLASVI